MARRRLGLLLALALAACAPGDDGPPLATSAHPIINGVASPATQDFVVQIALRTDRGMLPLCSGSLIAKNLVLTARHCTGDVDLHENRVESFEPRAFAIFTGTNAGTKASSQTPEAGVTKIVAAGSSLFPDLAILMLDKDVDAPIVSIRMQGAIKNERLDVVGFGVTENDSQPAFRLQRQGVQALHIAPERTPLEELAPGEFQIGEAACRGDSGGPALSAGTGAIVGIASRVLNLVGDPHSQSADICIGDEAEAIYTDLTPFQTQINAAFTEANAEPWLEGDLSPEEKAAEAAAAAKAAEDRKAAESGCAAAPSAPPGDATSALLFAGLALALTRRRRR